VAAIRIAAQEFDGEATEGVDGDEAAKRRAVATASCERHGRRACADEAQRRLVKLGGMDRETGGAQGHEAAPGVVQGCQAAGGKAHRSWGRTGYAEVATGYEAAGAHQGEADPHADRHAIEEGRQGFVDLPQVEGRAPGAH